MTTDWWMQTEPEGFCVKQPHITHSVVVRGISDHTQLQSSTLSSLCALEGCTSIGLPWLCTNYAKQLCTSRKPKHRRVCVCACLCIFIDQVWCFTFPLYHPAAPSRFHLLQPHRGRSSEWPGGGRAEHWAVFCSHIFSQIKRRIVLIPPQNRPALIHFLSKMKRSDANASTGALNRCSRVLRGCEIHLSSKPEWRWGLKRCWGASWSRKRCSVL